MGNGEYRGFVLLVVQCVRFDCKSCGLDGQYNWYRLTEKRKNNRFVYMNRKWWKFLLPIPFIFVYCYCVSFPNQREEDADYAYEASQQETQITQEATRTTEPPPPSPTEKASQSPPEPTADSVAPVPQNPQATSEASLPVEPEPPRVAQAENVPPQSTTRPSVPPPASPMAAQAAAVAPVVAPDPPPAPEIKTKEEDEEVIIALVTLSAVESENKEEKPPQIPVQEKVQQSQSTVDDSVKKQKASEYARSTAKVSVSQETFEADKKHVLNMINDLDVYMETGDYKGWRNCLSEESRNYWSKPQNLRKAAAKLPISGIKLNNMEDYFNYVFIPARKGRKVEEIRYVTETQVKAVQVEEDVDMVFYHFKKVDGKWRLFLPRIKD